MEETAKPQTTPEKQTANPVEQPPAKVNKKSNSRIMILIAVILVLVVGGYGLYTNMQKTQKPMEGTIKIAVLGTFSGDADTGSFPALKGAQLAKKDLNAT